MKIPKKMLALGVCSVGLVAGIYAEKQASNPVKYPVMYSAEAVEHLTGKWEGCRTEAYRDTGGLWTQGVGHLCGRLKPTETMTVEEVTEVLIKDLIIAEKCVMDNFNGAQMTKGQREAITDFVFNVGCAKASNVGKGKMTKIRTYALTGNYSAMCDAFLNWAYGKNNKGVIVRIDGLYARRVDERKWCLK